MITKVIHDINTFACTKDNETFIHGKDEQGKEIRLLFNTIELLEWLDISYMKHRSEGYIKNL